MSAHPHLTQADVWTLIAAGCNETEIAEYAGVRRGVAHAMIARATRLYANGSMQEAA